MQNDKYDIDEKAKERLNTGYKDEYELESQNNNFEAELAHRKRKLKEINTKLYSYSALLDEKDAELEKLRRSKADYETSNLRASKEKQMLQEDLMSASERKAKVEQEASELASMTGTLANEHGLIGKRIKDSVYEINALRANIQAEQDKLDMIHNVNLKRTSELTETMNEKNKEKSEARKLQLINTRMQEDNKAMVQRMEGIKNRITDISKDRDDLVIYYDMLKKELARIIVGVNIPKRSCLEKGDQIKRLNEEQETLQRMLDQYRKDIDFHKKLHEIEYGKKQELEMEHRRLRDEALAKDIEAISAKKELARVRDNHELLLEDQMQLGMELGALKQHAELLENHNIELHNELQRFVDTDEVVRQDLNIRPKAEYIKSKNSEELRKSGDRIREILLSRKAPY